MDEIELIYMGKKARLEYMYKHFKSVKKAQKYGKKEAISMLNYKLHTTKYELDRKLKENESLIYENEKLTHIVEYLQDRVETMACDE